MISLKEFETFIENDIVYEQHLLYYIDDLGRENLINNVGHLHSVYDKCIKIEGLKNITKIYLNIVNLFYIMDPSPVTGFDHLKIQKASLDILIQMTFILKSSMGISRLY